MNDHKIHPWYGPCDAIADGNCSECEDTVDSLRSELAQVRAERDDLLAKIAADSEEVQRAWLSPAEADALRRQRDELRAEVERLNWWGRLGDSLCALREIADMFGREDPDAD